MAGEQKLPCGTTKAERVQSKWFHSRCLHLFLQGLSQNLNWMCFEGGPKKPTQHVEFILKKNASCPAVMYVVLERQSFSKNRKSRLDLKIDLRPQKNSLLFCCPQICWCTHQWRIVSLHHPETYTSSPAHVCWGYAVPRCSTRDQQ